MSVTSRSARETASPTRANSWASPRPAPAPPPGIFRAWTTLPAWGSPTCSYFPFLISVRSTRPGTCGSAPNTTGGMIRCTITCRRDPMPPTPPTPPAALGSSGSSWMRFTPAGFASSWTWCTTMCTTLRIPPWDAPCPATISACGPTAASITAPPAATKPHPSSS